MSQRNRNRDRPPLLLREGEGVLIPTKRVLTKGPTGEAAEISIDLASAQVPDRRYTAEIASVKLESDFVRLMFGQRAPTGDELSSLLSIQLSFTGVHHFVSSMRSVAVSLRGFLEKVSCRPSQLVEITGTPDQYAVLSGNIVAAAFHGREACLDFYHASSFAMAAVLRGSGSLRADPVVRVTLSSPLLLAISEFLSSHESQIPSDEIVEAP